MQKLLNDTTRSAGVDGGTGKSEAVLFLMGRQNEARQNRQNDRQALATELQQQQSMEQQQR